MVTIRASLCEKCMVDASKSENDTGLLGAVVDPLVPRDRWLFEPH